MFKCDAHDYINKLNCVEMSPNEGKSWISAAEFIKIIAPNINSVELLVAMANELAIAIVFADSGERTGISNGGMPVMYRRVDGKQSN